MSLARTALRLAGILALGQDPVIARMCEGRVYDSRIEPLDEREPVPVITVLTEEMHGKAWSANNGGPPFDDHCELVIEIAMTAVVTVEDPDNPGQTLEVYAQPATSREMEAVLDMLEHRAVEALTVADSPASFLLRETVLRRVGERSSKRFVDAESAVKLAVRQITMAAELKGDDQRDARGEGGNAYPGAPWATYGDYPNLPDPLRTVCQAMPTGSSAQLVCQLLNDTYEPEAADLLNGVDATYAPQGNLYPGGAPPKPELYRGAAPPKPAEPGSSPGFARRINIP